ncbi:pentatricopeptide repeat-containing protein, putative [Ricinus communis]|uniref:Pentatricopeptide repeat-containing protein, putative n=1 Tax=Ricinus communis TaxID=3988 RepID=B9SUE8_RICCO|nr:pentatricopeptide repeat-containing protein, putative [Ricinus communis]
MMKKVIAVLLLSIVCSSTCSLAADKNEETQTPPKGVAPNWPWHRVSKQQPGRAYPTGPWNQPWAKGFPPMPSPVPVVPSPSPIAKCFKEFHIERGCYQQILTSFFTHKLNLAPECCKHQQEEAELEEEKQIASLIQKCPNLHFLRQIHARILTRLLPIPTISFLLSKILSFSALSPLGDLNYARKIFAQIPNPGIFPYNTIIRGCSYAKNPSREPYFLYKSMVTRGFPRANTFTMAFVLKACASIMAFEEGRQIHARILRSGFSLNPYVQSSLVSLYGKCEEIRLAKQVFDEITERNLVCWSAMISGYARVGMVNEALSMFREMQEVGIEPDEVSLVGVISACAMAGALDIGRWIHAYIKKRMIHIDLELNTALVNMYAKCGCIEKAKEIFDYMPVKDSKAWSSMIVGLAIHGLAEDALEMFSRMEEAKETEIKRGED